MKWQKFGEQTILFEDDKNYLVCWEDSEGNKSVPIIAFWSAEEDNFFPLHCNSCWPIRVDYFCDLPEDECEEDEPMTLDEMHVKLGRHLIAILRKNYG